MRIGVPREIKVHEYRVGLVPAGVRELTGAGHQVIVANLGTVQPSSAAQSLRFTVFVRPGGSGPLGVTNTSTVSSSTPDATPGNNTSSTTNEWQD